MRQLLVYIAAFAILADQLPLHSQPIDGLLPGLSWVPNSWGATVAAPTIVQPQTTGFVIGWNWAPPYSPIGRMIRGTHFHVGDAFDDAGNTRLTGLQRMMRDCHVAGAALIPAVRGISDGIDGTPLSSPSYSNPGAAIGIEYAPWIDFNTATNDVVLNSNDASRAIAGFRTRTLGDVVGTGTANDPFMLHLERDNVAHADLTLALDEPTMDTVITYKWEDRSQETALRPYANPEIQTIPDPNNPGQLISLLYDRWSHRYMNTEVMRVSITLRRAEVNPTGSDDDDVVLEIRLPYALGTVEDALGSVTRADIPAVGLRPTYINFAHLPNNVLPPAFPNVHPTYANATPVPTGRLSDTRQTGTASIPNATNREFVIRKGMLPPLGDPNGEEVTIYAEFRCDWDPTRLLNQVQVQGQNINNRRFPPRYRSPLADQISRMGIEVWYNEDPVEGLGVNIRSIRLETPHMTNFMFGYHNELIRASANRFVNDVDQRLNRPEVIRAATPPIVEIAYNPPAGVSPAAPITVWRFYGYDEPAQVHWLAFRRINAMLGGLLITEIGAEDHDKQVHMMGQETFWQGFGFNTSSNIASYTYNLGFDRWSQAIRLQPQAGETQENYSARMRNLQRNWEQSYAGLKLGLFNLRFPQPPFEVIPPQPNAIEGAQSFRFDVPHNNATFQDDPDTYLERRQHSPIPLPLPFSTTDPLTWDELSNPPQDPRAIELIEHRYLDEHVDMTGGILASLEGAMRVSYRDQSRMLWGIDPARPNLYMPWIANIWPQYYLRTEAGGFGAPGLNMLRLENHAAFFLNNRPKTATEMRLSYWMPLILGAKGLMIYKGPTSTEQGAEPLNPDPTAEDRYFEFTHEIIYRNMELGLGTVGTWTEDPPTSALNNLPYVGRTDEQVMTLDDVNPEWLTAAEPNNTSAYYFDRNDAAFPNTLNMTGLEETVDSLDGMGPMIPNNNPRIFGGGLSMRTIAREVTDRLLAMRTNLGRSTIANQGDPLFNLRLRGWYGKGFSVINCQHPDNIPTQALDRFFDIENFSTRLKSRHLRRFRDRTNQTINPGHFDYESWDSVFVDLTIHEIQGVEISSGFVLGVLNRRTDPRLPVPRNTFNVSNDPDNSDHWELVMHNEWQNEVDNDPELMYAQRGARQITIPFDFTHDDGRYHLLRLQELGGGIDTIVGQDKELAVNFLPGEGKMFRVTVLDAETPAMGSGWLSHNTQRKMVVYPTLTTPIVNDVITPAHDICGAPEGLENETFVRAQEAGGYRYHMVFHRRVSEDPNQLVNPLTVYYRRSELLTNDATNAADVDENGIYNPLIDWEDPIALTLIDRNGVAVEPVPSCGYPSIVVRNDVVFNGALMNPAVYVVYSCQGNIPNEILIVEAQLAANLFTHAAQVNSYENERSNVIATASSNPQCPGEQNDQLRYWGTPVINASLRGNYYAWSDYTDGIHVGFKTALVRDFVPGSIDILKYHVGSAMKAQYPSVPSYSKLAIGEDDCPIVWQEGPTGSGIAPACIEGRSIHYTRLFHLGNDVEHRLAARGVYQAGLNPFARNGDLLKISQTQNENANSFNRKPTIYRHLSEYDDALTDESSPFYINGYVNHKAERIAWEFKMIPPPGGQGGLTANRWQLRRTAIDVWDECTEDERSSYWHSGYSQIFAPGYDLVNPELIQGEQKTVLGAVINSEDIAQSWAFGDSSLVLSFNSEDGPSFPAAYHMTFAGGYHLDGNVNITESNGLGWAALDVSMNSLTGGVQGARAPHVAARHNIVRSQSLQKNRRITEAVPSFAQIGNYLPTPLIDRSTRGFYKPKDGFETAGDRIWHGFRSDDLEALIADVTVDGRTLSVDNRKSDETRTMQTQWFTASALMDLDITSLAEGLSATKASAMLVRKSDNQQLELPVLNVIGATTNGTTDSRAQKFSWKLLGDTTDLYRIVLSTRDDAALSVEDIEIGVVRRTNARSGHTANEVKNMGYIDGFAMRHITSSSASSEAIVWPNPASEVVVVACSSRQTFEPDRTVRVHNSAGESVVTLQSAYSAKEGYVARIDVSSMPPGVYSVRIGNESCTAMFVVTR